MKYNIVTFDCKRNVSIHNDCFSFDFDYEISDFCVHKIGYILVSPKIHCLFLSNDEFKKPVLLLGECMRSGFKYDFASLLNNPCSISYNKNSNTMALAEDGGKSIRNIVVYDNFRVDFESGKKYVTTINLIQGSARKLLDTHFNNMVSRYSPIHVDDVGVVHFAPIDVGKYFSISNFQLRHVAGNGKRKYVNSNSLINSSFNMITGIVSAKKDIYISDGGSACIRKISDGNISLFYGDLKKTEKEPNQDSLSFPQKIKVSDRAMYVMDSNTVKVIFFNTKKLYNIYSSDKRIISFDIFGDKLYILELLT